MEKDQKHNSFHILEATQQWESVLCYHSSPQRETPLIGRQSFTAEINSLAKWNMGSSCHLFFSYWSNLQSLSKKQAGFMSVLANDSFRLLYIRYHRHSMVLSQNWHNTQPHSVRLFRTLTFIWADKLLEPCSAQISHVLRYLWFINRSLLTFISYLLLWCCSWSYIVPFHPTLNSSVRRLSYPCFLHLNKNLQQPHIYHYLYLYSRLFCRRVAGFRSGRGHSPFQL